MKDINLTKAEKIERAKVLRDFMLGVHRDEEKSKIFWENVWSRAYWTLEGSQDIAKK